MNKDRRVKSVDRFLQKAEALGFDVEVKRFSGGTRTAEDAAAAAGCDISQIVKSLVFMAGGVPIIVLTSGANRVDTGKVSDALGVPEIRRAAPDEARMATGFAVGGTPPFGYEQDLRVVIDADLLRHDSVWAAAGSPDAIFETSPERLMEAAGAAVLDVREERGQH